MTRWLKKPDAAILISEGGCGSMEFSQTGSGGFAPGGTCSPAKQSHQLDIGVAFLGLPLL